MISKTRWVLVLAVLTVWLVPSVARAVSVRDLVELSRAGLCDEILLAVLEADPTIFDLDAGTIIEIRAAGLSEYLPQVRHWQLVPAADIDSSKKGHIPLIAGCCR